MFIINIVIRAAWLWLFAVMGWLSLQWHGDAITTWELTWQRALLLLGCSLVFSLVNKLVAFLLIVPLGISALFTLGCTIIFAGTIINAVVLWLGSVVVPDVIALSGFWPTVLCGMLLNLTLPSHTRKN